MTILAIVVYPLSRGDTYKLKDTEIDITVQLRSLKVLLGTRFKFYKILASGIHNFFSFSLSVSYKIFDL